LADGQRHVAGIAHDEMFDVIQFADEVERRRQRADRDGTGSASELSLQFIGRDPTGLIVAVSAAEADKK
jgi:hypothetical protein